jgi:hypothetical protein
MRFFLIFIFCMTSVFASPSLAEKLEKAQVGDYIVTEIEKTISLLRIRELSSTQLILEEITAPLSALKVSKIDWSSWLKDGAKGHTSWLFYEIDLTKGELLECYSLTQKGWIAVDEPLLPKMLTLPLSQTPNEKRKRIGPAPQGGEEDQRALWLPPLHMQGKKVSKPPLEVYETKWPKDQSQLSECRLELYFMHNFPLPFWIEGSNGHFTFKIRTLDCGHDLASPVEMAFPHRPPRFVGKASLKNGHLCLTLRTPPCHEGLHLFAVDVNEPNQAPFSVAFKRNPLDKDHLLLEVEKPLLKKLFKAGHSYRWLMTSEEDVHLYAETEDLFRPEKGMF